MFWTTRRSAPRTRLAAEELSPREVPAVIVAVEGDVMRFTGSDRDDTVRVEAVSGTPGRYQVTTFTAGDESHTVWTIDNPAVRSIRFDGFQGDDTFVNDTGLASLAFGGDGNDELVGGAGADELRGGLGADTVLGKGGADDLQGGGADTLRGGAGNDALSGGDGNDDMYGGDGNDVMYGGNGDDTMQGGDGTDALYGDTGTDTLAEGFLPPPSSTLTKEQTPGLRTGVEAAVDSTESRIRDKVQEKVITSPRNPPRFL